MTKKELSQLYYLNQEITRLQSRIYELETAATSTTRRITGMPFGCGITDKTGRYATELTELKNELEGKLTECARELRRLTNYINSIEDSEMRQIMTLRYINGMSWQRVAFSINRYDEQYPRRKHNRFLKLSEDEKHNEDNYMELIKKFN